ncbi:MAG TPA: stage II sporulation protein M [Candidatus Limnocylindrales bacterium]|nr:stage II sporulation protein M [Candidatus Limnocylindrales bacterium]
MPVEEIRSYLHRLRPYLVASIFLFGIGLVIGLMIVNRFPQMAETFESSLASFIKVFRGLPKFKLAGAIFVNNTVKTLAMILLGALLGVVPAFFLIVNGAALGMVLSLSGQTRGIWVSLLSVLPHGILELPAVFLGTAIGIMLGTSIARKLFARSTSKIGTELGHALKFFCSVIVPLLLVAAIVEAYVTPALASR